MFIDSSMINRSKFLNNIDFYSLIKFTIIKYLWFYSGKSNILRDLATIEADVTSHLEAILHERLSKANRDKILQEQRSQASSSLDQENNLRKNGRTAKGMNIHGIVSKVFIIFAV